MNKKKVFLGFIFAFLFGLAFGVLYSRTSILLAAPPVGVGPPPGVSPLTGSSTSTFIAVYSEPNVLTGFSDFTFSSSSKLFAVNATSSLQSITFTNAFGTNIAASGFITAGIPIGVASGGTGTSTYISGVVLASSTNPFTTVAPGVSGNVLTSNGSTWTSEPPTPAPNSVGASQTKIETVPLMIANISGAIVTATVTPGSVILGYYVTAFDSPNLASTFSLSITGDTLTARTITRSNAGGFTAFNVVLLKP